MFVLNKVQQNIASNIRSVHKKIDFVQAKAKDALLAKISQTSCLLNTSSFESSDTLECCVAESDQTRLVCIEFKD